MHSSAEAPSADRPDKDDDAIGVAARLELFLRRAAAARDVAIYAFSIPHRGSVALNHDTAAASDPRTELYTMVSITGGAVGKAADGLRAYVPLARAKHFETLARSLIGAHLQAFNRGALDILPDAAMGVPDMEAQQTDRPPD